MMKNFIVFTFVAILASLVITSECKNQTWGAVGPRDSLIYQEEFTVNWKLFRVVSRDMEYYPKNSNRTISAIKTIDLSRGNNGGYASLKKGGPGFRNATIRFKSVRNHGLHFAAEIYGH